jgi:hypothetical protein
VTVHGIGFQQPPEDGLPGYADDLHAHLSEQLGASVLGDDPLRGRSRAGENGAIYVQSSWPPETDAAEPGLARLGRWSTDPREVDGSTAPLSDGAHPVAHVALVYSHLEGRGAAILPTLQTALAATAAAGRYTSLAGIARSLVLDIPPMLTNSKHDAAAAGASLHVRTDRSSRNPSGLLATLRQLENDVAVYVSHNDLRERVRGFVREALLRLCYRTDIGGIVVNSHSNGTVVAFDVLRELPPSAIGKIRALVTAGSPLRKYTRLLDWGDDVGRVHDIPIWRNFWDRHDPVADPLEPGSGWRPGARPHHTSPGLYRWVNPDSGESVPAGVIDVELDNLRHSAGGGLQAHNYWDNRRAFTPELARLLRDTRQ